MEEENLKSSTSKVPRLAPALGEAAPQAVSATPHSPFYQESAGKSERVAFGLEGLGSQFICSEVVMY